MWIVAEDPAVSPRGESLCPAARRADIPSILVTNPPERKKHSTMAKDVIRVVTRGTDGKLRIRDYNKQDAIKRMHMQIGVDDCSTDLDLRGLPVFRGLIGPMPEGKNVIRYESPEVFETLTKEWSLTKVPRRSRTRAPAGIGSESM